MLTRLDYSSRHTVNYARHLMADDTITYRLKHSVGAELRAAVAEIHPQLRPYVLQSRYAHVLQLFLTTQGWDTVVESRHGPETGFDVTARHRVTNSALAAQFKHTLRGSIGSEMVRATLGKAADHEFDRILVVSNAAFTPAAIEVASQLGSHVELVTLDDIVEWSKAAEDSIEPPPSVIQVITREMADKLARAVAQDPDLLDEIDWRKMEELLAEAIHGLGYDVALTRMANDKGRDIVVELKMTGDMESYWIEIKHWPSKPVNPSTVGKFVKVVASERATGGLFLSSSGYTSGAYEILKEVEHQHIYHGGRNKIIAICQTYVRSTGVLWEPTQSVHEMLFSSDD